jgi:hypothetical protein
MRYHEKFCACIQRVQSATSDLGNGSCKRTIPPVRGTCEAGKDISELDDESRAGHGNAIDAIRKFENEAGETEFAESSIGAATGRSWNWTGRRIMHHLQSRDARHLLRSFWWPSPYRLQLTDPIPRQAPWYKGFETHFEVSCSVSDAKRIICVASRPAPFQLQYRQLRQHVQGTPSFNLLIGVFPFLCSRKGTNMYTAVAEGDAALKSYHLVIEVYVGCSSAHSKFHTEGPHCIIPVFE